MPSLDQETIVQVEIQKNRVEALYELVGSMTSEMSACTHAMRDLTTQFAVYTEKHDNTEKALTALTMSQTKIHESINEHSIAIAQMKPTVESVRGLVWKVLTSIILGMGGLGLVLSSIAK